MKRLAANLLAILGLTILSAGSAITARAAFTFTLSEAAGNVVLVGSGSINTSALTIEAGNQYSPQIVASVAILQACSKTNPVGYTLGGGGLTGPTSFGNGLSVGADSGSGQIVGVLGYGSYIVVPQGYVSGTPLADSATFNNTTLNKMGFNAGTYVYTWGTGADADSLTVIAVPEPSTWATLGVGVVGAGIVALHRRRVA